MSPDTINAAFELGGALLTLLSAMKRSQRKRGTMAEANPKRVYVYQPMGMQHPVHWAARAIYGVAGPGLELATINGLTKDQAEAVCDALYGKPQAGEL